jgi:hypothetical protein
MGKIECACGCGETFQEIDDRGRKRKYANGHNSRGRVCSEEQKEKTRQSMLGFRHTEESKKLIGDKLRGKYPEGLSSNWNGGTDKKTWHNKAWERFKVDNCQECNLPLSEYQKNRPGRRFDMHCTSEPKDYSIMEKENWMPVCTSCHKKIEIRLKGVNK